MNHPLQCQCGKIKGYVIRPGMAERAVCYCKDCRAFARFLGQADTVLDAQGGTPIVATLPGQVHFLRGLDSLACMSLSDRGLLRWYAGCCKTPIGNTPRDFKMPYVGLVENCLHGDAPSLQESFGPVRAVLNTKSSAEGHVKSTPVSKSLSLLKIMKSVIAARLNGSYRRNPFFETAAGTPIVQPRVLTKTERERVTDGA